MGQSEYQIILHESAQRELDAMPSETRDKLTTQIKDAAQRKQPTNHPNVKPLRETNGLFRFRAGDYRAVGDLDLPHLRILAIGEREGFYEDKKYTAMERATDSI